MTEERDERLVAALESIAASLERLSVPLVTDAYSTWNVPAPTSTPWPAPWSMAVTSS